MITREIAEAGHPTKPLGEIVTFLDHKRRPVKQSDRTEGPYPYYGANGLQGTIDGYIFDEQLLLLAEDGGHFDDPDRGIAYEISGKSWVNNHAHVIKPNSDGLDISFLRRVLENYDVRPFINGSTRSKLTKAQAERIPIPLPPLEEQRRIAAILDKADALRRKRKRALELLDTLTQSIFVEMFGRPGDPNSFVEQTPLGELAELINGDRSSNYPSGDDIVNSGVLFLNTTNITPEGLDLRSANYITKEKFASLSRGKLAQGDIVITLRGSLGQTAIFENADETGFINAQMMIIRPRDEIEGRFLLQALQLGETLTHLKKIGSGSAVPQLTGKQIADLEIPVPNRESQRTFGCRSLAIRKIRATAMRDKSKLDILFASLQHRAFSGQL